MVKKHRLETKFYHCNYCDTKKDFCFAFLLHSIRIEIVRSTIAPVIKKYGKVIVILQLLSIIITVCPIKIKINI